MTILENRLLLIVTFIDKERIMNRIMLSTVAIMLFLVTSVPLFAGSGNRTGTGGAAQLNIPTGARDLALGGATVATTTGIDALFWNPAGVAKSHRSANLIFSHMSYIADIGVEYGAVSGAFGDLGTFALSVKSLSIGEIPVTTTSNPDGTGQTFTPQFFTTGLTYSRLLSDRISVGLTANLISERMSDVSSSGVAFTIGLIYDNLADFKGLSLGVVVRNIGPQMGYDGPGLYQVASVEDQNRPPQFYKVDTAPFELPSTIEFGLGYTANVASQSQLTLCTSYQNNNFSEDEYKLGAEYCYDNLLYLRGGWALAPSIPENSTYIFGGTVGAGIQTNLGDADVAIDYAFRDTEFFSGSHTIAIRIGF